MLHALRNASPKAREARDAGFTLIEILVAMVLMAIVMSSLAVFFIGTQKSTASLRIRENAAVIADQAMDHVHSIDATKLVAGRDTSSATTQWNATKGATPTIVGVDVTTMTFVSDSTVAAGSGASANLPTTTQPLTTNNTPYRVNTLVGTCYIQRGGGDCTPLPGTDPVLMDRVVVAVNWTDTGRSCPHQICAYVIASLISPTVDPTFNVNQVLIDTTPPSTPTLTSCAPVSAPGDDLGLKISAWSPSTDASGVAEYDIYEGTSPDFSKMTKDGTMPSAGPYPDTTGLKPSTPYYFAIVALDNVGNQSLPQVPTGTTTNPQQPFMISCSTNPDIYPPSKPTLNSPGSSTTSTTTFSWPTSTDDYKMGSYQVFRNGTLLQTVSAATTSYTDTGLSPYVTYQYTVKAVDFYGNVSPASAALLIQTKDTVAPVATTTLTATAKPWPAVEIDLDWGDYTDDVATTGYTVYRSTTAGGPFTSIALTTTSTYADTTVVTNKKYYYEVTAHDAVPNTSAFSNVANASTPDTVPPTAPTNLVAASKTTTTVTLTWNPSTDVGSGVAGYNIYRNGGTTPINVSAVTGTSYTDSGLTQLTGYTYTVTAYDAAGNVSPTSSTLSVTTVDGIAPTAPPTVSTTGQTWTTIGLTWTASYDFVGVTGYTVFRNGVQVGTTTGALTFSDTGLAPNTTYTYTVKANDAAGNYSLASTPLAVTTVKDTTIPSTVANLKGSSGVKNATTLTWNASSDNVAVASYRIYIGGALSQSVAFPGLSYTYAAPALANSSTYLFTVYAVDTSGNVSLVSAQLKCVVDGGGNVVCT